MRGPYRVVSTENTDKTRSTNTVIVGADVTIVPNLSPSFVILNEVKNLLFGGRGVKSCMGEKAEC